MISQKQSVNTLQSHPGKIFLSNIPRINLSKKKLGHRKPKSYPSALFEEDEIKKDKE